MRKAALIALGAMSGSISCAAKMPSISAFTLMSPSPSVTGTIRTNTRLTAGSRQSRTNCRRPRAHGGRNRQRELKERRRQDRARVHIELAVPFHPRNPMTSPAMMTTFQKTGERRNGEVLVAVQDPDDHPEEAEQKDDRKKKSREPLRAGPAHRETAP